MVNIYKHSTPIIKRFTEQRFEILLQEQGRELEEQEKMYRELENSFTKMKLEHSQLQNFINTCHDLSDDLSRELQNEYMSKSFLRDTSIYLEKLKDEMKNIPSFEKMSRFYGNMQVMLDYMEKLGRKVITEYKPTSTCQRSGRPQSVLGRLGSTINGGRTSLKDKMQEVVKIVGIVIQTIGNRTEVTANLIKPDLKEVMAVVREVMDDVIYVKDVFKSTLKQKRKLESELVSLAHNWQEIRRLEREVKEKQGHITELNRESLVLKRKTRGQQQRKHLNQIHLNIEQKKIQLRELQKMLERNLGSADVRLHHLLGLLPDLEDDDTRSDTDLSNSLSTYSSRTGTPHHNINVSDEDKTNVKQTIIIDKVGEARVQKEEASEAPSTSSEGVNTNITKQRLLERRSQQQQRTTLSLVNPTLRSRDFRIHSQTATKTNTKCVTRNESKVAEKESSKTLRPSMTTANADNANNGKSQEVKTGTQEKELKKATPNTIDEWIELQQKQNRTQEIQKKLENLKIIQAEDRMEEIQRLGRAVIENPKPVESEHNETKVNADEEKKHLVKKNEDDTKRTTVTERKQNVNKKSPSPLESASGSALQQSKSADSDQTNNDSCYSSQIKSSGLTSKQTSHSGSRENSSGSEEQRDKNKSPEIVDRSKLPVAIMGISSLNKKSVPAAVPIVRHSMPSAITDYNNDPLGKRSTNQGQRQALSTTKVNLALPGT